MLRLSIWGMSECYEEEHFCFCLALYQVDLYKYIQTLVIFSMTMLKWVTYIMC